MRALVVCVLCSLFASGAAWGQARSGPEEAAQQTRMAIFPVVYDQEQEGEPRVAPLLDSIHQEARQAWSGPVLAQGSLDDAIRVIWLTEHDQAGIAQMHQTLAEAERRFRDPEQGAGAAIEPLERLLHRADALLPHASREPRDAEALLRAHLLLWWALREVGETSRLPSLMRQAAGRFPAARVDSGHMPPFVVEAFVQAQARGRQEEASTLVIRLEGAREQGCRILLNGSALGEERNAALALPSGRTYYVQAGCGADQLPIRRVVVEGSQELLLDLQLARQMRDRAAGVTLVVPGGEGSAAEMASLGTSMGQALEVGNVILVGVVEDQEALQLDRVRVFDGRRLCSVRIPLEAARDSASLYGALRAVVAGRPTRFSLLFAGEDGVYRTPEDYVENVIGQKRVFTWVTGGLGVLTLGTAVVFEFLSAGYQQELDDCVATLSCRGSTRSEATRRDLDDALLTRNVLYLTSGGLLLSAALLYVLEAPDVESELETPMQGARLTPWISGSSAGLGLEGRW